MKKYWEENHSNLLEYKREYYKKYNKTRHADDTQYRLSNTIKSRLRKAIRNNQKRGVAIQDIGCTIEELKSYIQNKFKPGMSWDNWGKNTWHIDHIIPPMDFDLTDNEQFLKASNYKNLQPLWAEENLKKGRRSSI